MTTDTINGAVAATKMHYLSLLRLFRKRDLLLALAGMMATSLLSGVSILLLVPLVESIGFKSQTGMLPGRIGAILEAIADSTSLGSLLGLFVLLVAANSVILRWLNLFTADLSRSFTRTLEKRLYAAIMKADWTFFLKHRNSDMAFALTNNVHEVSSGTKQLLQVSCTVILAAIHGALCFAISPLLAMSLLIGFLGYWFCVRKIDRKARQAGYALVNLKKELHGNVINHLDGMKEARSLGAEQRQIEAFNTNVDDVHRTHLSFRRTNENAALLFRVGSAIALCGVLYVALEVLSYPPFDLVLLLVIAGRLLPRLKLVHSSSQQILHLLPAIDSLMDLLQQCEESRVAEASVSSPPLALQDAISVINVGFSYDDDVNRPVLQDLSLCVPAGSILAIVGKSGAGKTTLADVLMGLLRPGTGEVHVDDVVLTDENSAQWRQSIGYVPQETFLLHDTLRANLLWAKPDATDLQLMQALRAAAAEEFVQALPSGLETIVGDRGASLSGGERQRIAMARALLRRPRLLILDEATSSLDSQNEQHIHRAIERLRGDVTIVLISHRLSSVAMADQIVVVEDGTVTEQGAYSDLVNRTGGRFSALIAEDAATAA